MALANGDAELGDVLFIARGASVPLIISPTDPSFRLGKRRADDPDPEFKFVGGAYMAGVMDGEVVQQMDKIPSMSKPIVCFGEDIKLWDSAINCSSVSRIVRVKLSLSQWSP